MNGRFMRRTAYALGLMLTLGAAGTTFAGDAPQAQWVLKRNFKKVDAYRWALKHPVNYWWDNNPSMVGNWDYFTPIEHPFEAVPLLVHQPALVEQEPTLKLKMVQPAHTGFRMPPAHPRMQRPPVQQAQAQR